jgi:hypothetical protein
VDEEGGEGLDEVEDGLILVTFPIMTTPPVICSQLFYSVPNTLR